MKIFIGCVAWWILFAQADILNAQQTNRLLQVLPSNHESAPLPWGTRTNLAPAGWSKVKQPPAFDAIGTNTAAFNDWAAKFMVTQANMVLTNWGLERQGQVTTNDTTWYFYAARFGPSGSIATTDGRYVWGFHYGWMDLFQDEDYFARTLAYSDERAAELAKFPNVISKTEVRRIAEDALHSLGFTPASLGLREHPKITQYYYQMGGKKMPLPLFEVVWGDTEDLENNAGVKMQVSGIIKKVVSYSNYAHHTPRFPLPTNYFDMLGVEPLTNAKQ